MKRQSEELFFKYISNASRPNNSYLIFSIPDDYEPLYGDIIEMIISEPNTYGGATYYAKLVVYKEGDDIYFGVLDGRLKGEAGEIYPLKSAGYNNSVGNKSITLYANDQEIVLFSEEGNLINMIVHRPKAEMELYVA